MRRTRIIFPIIIFSIVLFFASVVSAQKTYTAKGSIESSGDGLWDYYKGKTKTTVKRNAPMFEKIDENTYLLDYTKIKGVELYLSAEFKDNKLVMLQITTPFPEYKSCGKDTKDLSRSFAEIGYSLMGLQFEKKQCSQQKGSGTPYLCSAEDSACVYRLCPGKTWALACSQVK